MGPMWRRDRRRPLEEADGPGALNAMPRNWDLLLWASDDSKTWRPVEVSRLVSKQQSDISDRRICASAAAPKTCSIERILRKTRRFQKWLQAKRLTPDLVQGLAHLQASRGTFANFQTVPFLESSPRHPVSPSREPTLDISFLVHFPPERRTKPES
ncbi:hypothetical protein GH733_019125 [Mirounga leonina]|nr:hypothetical protein GH733_019125 [Mirounga leonina]